MATTEQSLYNIGVRKALNQMGVSDERISYDPNTGYVKVDSVPIIKPQLNVGGTTYTTQADINSIAGDVNRLNRLYNLQSQVLNPQQQTNPYDQQISQILSTLQQRIQNPTPINPYATPAYAAAQAQAQQQAQQATRSAQEALGAARLGRSSVLTDRAQAIQNQANQYLMTQVVPQIIAQEQARQQQEFQNLASILDALGQQQSLYDTRATNRFNQAFDILDFLMRQEQQQFANELARRSADLNETQVMAVLTGRLPDGTPTTAEQQRQLENEWRVAEETGQITPTLARLYGLPEGMPTLEAANIAFNQQLAKQEFGLRSREVNAQLANMAADNARAAQQANLDRLFKIWEATGVAPAGIPGVEPGTPLRDQRSNQKLNQEREGLVNALRTGQLTPDQAVQQINEDLALGFYTPEEAQQLIQDVQTITPTLNTAPNLTFDQLQQLWETDPTGRKAGAPMIDWISWYRSPTGRAAGLTFKEWASQYGPTIR